MSAQPYKFGVIFYSTKSYSEFKTFLLLLLCLYFSLYLFVENKKIENIHYCLILKTTTVITIFTNNGSRHLC